MSCLHLAVEIQKLSIYEHSFLVEILIQKSMSFDHLPLSLKKIVQNAEVPWVSYLKFVQFIYLVEVWMVYIGVQTNGFCLISGFVNYRSFAMKERHQYSLLVLVYKRNRN